MGNRDVFGLVVSLIAGNGWSGMGNRDVFGLVLSWIAGNGWSGGRWRCIYMG